MQKAPPWYEPLSDSERQTIAALVAKATGMPLRVPAAGEADDTPAGWLAEFDDLARRHVVAMSSRPANPKMYYDPRKRGYCLADTHQRT